MNIRRHLRYFDNRVHPIKPWKWNKLYILPLLVFVWFVGSFVVTYIISFSYGHIVPFLPFISDTGTYLPESAIFSQMLNIGSILLTVSQYMRHLQVRSISKIYNLNPCIKVFNTLCFWVSFLVAIGVTIVANFQESEAFFMHLVGTGLAVGFGVFFQILQTILCILIYPRLGSKSMNWIRIVIATVSFIALSYCMPQYFRGLCNIGPKARRMTPDDPDYEYQLLHAIAEWMIVLLTMVFILTFTYEFKTITLYEPQIKVLL